MRTHTLEIELSARAHKALKRIAARLGMTPEGYVAMLCEETSYIQPEHAVKAVGAVGAVATCCRDSAATPAERQPQSSTPSC